LEGLLVALDHLDEVIDLIRRSRTADTARANLQQRFKLTEVQAQAILEMQLRRLAALERRKIQEEYKEKLALIKELERLLVRPALMRGVVKQELQAVGEKYGDNRRTKIIATADGPITNLLPDHSVWVVVSEKGKLGRTPNDEPALITRKPAEQPLALLQASTRDILYLFTAGGRAVSLPVHQLPEAMEMGEGRHWADLTALKRKEHLAAALVLPAEATGYLFLTSLGGVVKRIRLEDLPGITSDIFTVINVPEDDSLGWVRQTAGNDEVVLVTSSGQAIRFKEEDVRPMGLPAGGVLGIKLADETDGVVAMDLARPNTLLWSITDNGLAKATPLDDYPIQGRYGQGVINVRLPKDAAEVVTGIVGTEKTQIIIKTASGATKKLRLNEAVIGGRAVRPRSVLTLGARNRVTGALCYLPRVNGKAAG
jgi:DNA gyrase subunit A